MTLRAKKPEAVNKRLKMLLFSPAGGGKTTAAIQFPRPYLIDTEKGAVNTQYVKLLEGAGGGYFGPDEGATDVEEVIKEVTGLLTEKHEYRTLVIDPLTVIYNNLLDKSAQELATKDDPTGTSFARHKGPADRVIKRLINLLLRLDMNVVITSHSKTKWEKNGKEIIDAGQTFDCYSKLDYLFDLVVELQKVGQSRFGIIRKTRLEAFPDGERFAWSFDEISKRYGGELLQRQAEAVVLANETQIARLNELIGALGTSRETVEKWLSTENVEAFEEMSTKAIQKYIDGAQKKLKSLAAA